MLQSLHRRYRLPGTILKVECAKLAQCPAESVPDWRTASVGLDAWLTGAKHLQTRMELDASVH